MLSSCAKPINNNVETKPKSDNNYIRGVWLAYYELQKFTGNNNEEGFKKAIDKPLSMW